MLYWYWYSQYIKFGASLYYPFIDSTTFMQWRSYEIAGVPNIPGC